MKKKNVINLAMAVMIMFLIVGFDPGVIKAQTASANQLPELMFTSESTSEDFSCIYNCINSLPFEDISASEAEVLAFIREEELLAHDVYVKLYQKFHLPAFNNISKSETYHTTAIKAILQKYNLPDPAVNHVEGVFQNPEIQQLYTSLVAQGIISLINAKTVGCIIEDYDISDLTKHLNEDVDNIDITLTLENLSKGSRNHMRAFYRLLKFHNILYEPQYISEEELNAIINHAHEAGNGFCICDPGTK